MYQCAKQVEACIPEAVQVVEAYLPEEKLSRTLNGKIYPVEIWDIDQFITPTEAENSIRKFPDLMLSVIFGSNRDTTYLPGISKNIERIIIDTDAVFTSFDLSMLSTCSNLEELYVFSRYKNFNSISRLLSLKVLYISGLSLGKYSRLTGFKIGNTNIGVFPYLPNLIQLHLVNTEIDDLKFLGYNKRLEVLDVSNSKLHSTLLPSSLTVFICYDSDLPLSGYFLVQRLIKNPNLEVRTNIPRFQKYLRT